MSSVPYSLSWKDDQAWAAGSEVSCYFPPSQLFSVGSGLHCPCGVPSWLWKCHPLSHIWGLLRAFLALRWPPECLWKVFVYLWTASLFLCKLGYRCQSSSCFGLLLAKLHWQLSYLLWWNVFLDCTTIHHPYGGWTVVLCTRRYAQVFFKDRIELLIIKFPFRSLETSNWTWSFNQHLCWTLSLWKSFA